MSYKVAIISPYYLPGLGYQEVFIAQTLADMGHAVQVYTTPCIPTTMTAKEEDFQESRSAITVNRYSPKFRYRETYFPDTNKIVNDIVNYKPDVVIGFNVPSGFLHPIIKKLQTLSIPKIVFFSDLYEFRKKVSLSVRFQQILASVVLQKPSWYRTVYEHVSLLICNTPETKTILSEFTSNPSHNKKMLQGVLGVNSQNFSFDANVRQHKRRELNVGDDEILLMTITKIIPRKGIELLMENAEKLYKNNPRIRYMIVGGLEDDYQRELEGKAREMSVPITLVARQPKSSLNALYNAADLTLWHFATHSIQESLFTGVAALLPKNEGVSHLLRTNNMGTYFSDISNINTTEIERLSTIENRAIRVQDASFLSYEHILRNFGAQVGLHF